MTMREYFGSRKEQVASFLTAAITTSAAPWGEVNDWGADVASRLPGFVGGGKMLRGGLVCLAAEMYGRPVDADVLTAAAALELYHSSFLIHDDVIDRDELRRGMPTIATQYARLGNLSATSDATHFGNAMGVCVGDAGFFLGFALLAQLEESACLPDLLTLFTRELAVVALAEMDDVALAMTEGVVTVERLLAVSRTKTGRYTFSLPLLAGALLAGQSVQTRGVLERFGEALGVIYQLRDDELGIFGDAAHLGKPVGSDIREGKKTLYYYYLMERASASDCAQLSRIFGCPDLTTEQVAEVRRLLQHYGVVEQVAVHAQELEATARASLGQLELPSPFRQILDELITYTMTRHS